MMSRVRLACSAALCALLAGCTVQMDVGVELREDDAAALAFDVSIDVPEGMADSLAGEMDLDEMGFDQDDVRGELHDNAAEFGFDPDAVTVEVVNEDGRIGMRVGVDPLPRESLEGMLTQSTGGSPALFESFEATREGDEFSVEAQIAPLSDTLGDELADDPALEGIPFDPTDMFRIRFSLRLPGTVTEHNADEVLEDGTLVWEASADEATVISARSTTGSTSLLLYAIAALAALAVIAVVAVVLMARRRRGRGRDVPPSEGWAQPLEPAAVATAPLPQAPPPPPAAPAPPAPADRSGTDSPPPAPPPGARI
ncbi:MAG TPA: hypothetical protein VML96_07965 [Egibacteraceae bacterium]|nr:hypothetical protein [Egibacteraceae bacterium]